jgi:hypothetical protein
MVIEELYTLDIANLVYDGFDYFRPFSVAKVRHSQNIFTHLFLLDDDYPKTIRSILDHRDPLQAK